MQELDLRHLRVICTVADAGSLSKAAAQLGISQPALSAQLHRIEQRVGNVLFDRSPQGVQPTEFGQSVIGGARVVLTEMESLSRVAAQRRPAHAQRTRVIGYSGPLLVAFAQRFDEAEVVSEPSLTEACAMVSARFDFGLTISFGGFGAPIPDSLSSRLVVVEPTFVGLAAGHRLATAAAVDLADLADEDWILQPSTDNGEHEALFRASALAGFTPHIVHQSLSSGMIRDLVSAGGVALFQALARRNDSRMVIRPLARNPLPVDRHLIWRPETPGAPAAYEYALAAYRTLLAALPTDARTAVTADLHLGTDRRR